MRLGYTLELTDFTAARQRIANSVRRTPLFNTAPVKRDIAPGAKLMLKLENLQPTGSFKVRGAMNSLLSLSKQEKERGLITASGGNHGLGVAYAAAQAGVPATIYLPKNTPEAKADKVRDWGAEVVWEGEVWDEANRAALAQAHVTAKTYIHPFAQETVIEGQGTIGLEIREQAPDVKTMLVAIGGGGLIAGIAAAAKLADPSIRIIGIEPVGAPTHLESRKAGKVVELKDIKTRAGTLAPRRTEDLNFDLIQANVDDIVLVSDEEMEEAARWLWFEFGIAAELSGAAACAALMAGRIDYTEGECLAAIVCGAGTDGIG
ncbi:MAG: threonine/serine dehydratase [Rhodospirillaceae bacterium]|nr:threonine/serine dehydratase [Rhodospirillaceae bacterium]